MMKIFSLKLSHRNVQIYSPFGSKRACSNSGMTKSLSNISDSIEGEILFIQ